MIRNQICKVLAFVLIGILLFFIVQNVFLPSWNGNGGLGYKVAGFQNLEENTLDVVFLGTSLVNQAISPVEIYEATGICSYNLGTPSQSIEASYYLLKEAFRSQNPKLVLLDPSSFFYTKSESTINYYHRTVMDNLYYTRSGLEMALEYGEIPGNEGVASAVFPMMLYHSRWDELTAEDFHPDFDDIYSSMGYYMMSYALPITRDVEIIYQNQTHEYLKKADNADVKLGESVHRNLSRIVELCRENDAAFVLMRLPSYRSPLYGGWTQIKSDLIFDLAEEYNVPFLDMSNLNIVDLGEDTGDGIHMNIRGAEKVSSYLGEYIVAHYPEISGGKNDVFEAVLTPYHRLRDVAMIQSERNFGEYFKTLADHSKQYTVLIATAGNGISGCSEEEMMILKEIGLQKIADIRPDDTYLAIVEGGNLLKECRSSTKQSILQGFLDNTASVTAANQYDVVVESQGAVIKINNKVYIEAEEGLCVVVWDNQKDLPVDVKTFVAENGQMKAVYSAAGNKQRLRNLEEAIFELR